MPKKFKGENSRVSSARRVLHDDPFSLHCAHPLLSLHGPVPPRRCCGVLGRLYLHVLLHHSRPRAPQVTKAKAIKAAAAAEKKAKADKQKAKAEAAEWKEGANNRAAAKYATPPLPRRCMWW